MELSIEEKAKRYDEAIEIAKEINNEQKAQPFNVMTRVFPELKESEDERIRKWIIGILSTYEHDRDLRNAAIAYLEKQGEQKPDYKVEPKFQNGQWIVWQNKYYKINDNGCGYELIDQNGLSTSLEYGTIDESAHLWTIQNDAKDGDVLDANGAPFIYKKHDKNYVYYYCGVNLGGEFTVAHGIDAWNSKYKVYPATKEQRDTLFVKMKEEGYEWDAEKKELNKIEQTPAWSKEDEKIALSIEQVMNCASLLNIVPDKIEKVRTWLKSLKDRVQPKQEWSKEDIRNIQDIDSVLFYDKDLPEDTCMRLRNWLKSLKPNKDMVEALRTEYEKGRADVITEMKSSWSEEDEKRLKSCLNILQPKTLLGNVETINTNWLKSLKERHTWKPSDEQMDALLKLEEMHVLEHENNQENAHLYMVVKSIREQLLKLREE